MFLPSSSKNKSEKFVSNRRLQEDRFNSLTTKLKQDFHAKELAKFENKTKDIIQAQFINKRLADLKKKHMEEIENRRQKLRILLDSENEQYKQEIKGLEETPEQVRERMYNRVQELKAQKEDQRKRDVEQKLERRFREGADELRKVESEINELKNMHFRNVQMMEKQELMEQQYEGK